MAWLTEGQLTEMKFARVGRNAMLSDKASYYNCAGIEVGDNSRIDDFCVLSAGLRGIKIGRHVHVSVYCSLIGRGRIALGDYSSISSRVAVYSSSDDFSGTAMTGPTLPSEFTNVHHADVTIGRHVIVGAGSIVLPGVVIGEGVAIGALSLVSKGCEAFGMYAGVPAKRVGERSRDLLHIEEKFLSSKAP